MTVNLNSGGYTIGNLTDDCTFTFPSNVSITSNVLGSQGNLYINNNTTGAFNWSDTISIDSNLSGSTLKVMGNAEFDGEVSIKGKNLSEMLDKIEQRLAILHPNEKLEEKWEQLKSLGQMYRELEAEIIEKEAMWAILKK